MKKIFCAFLALTAGIMMTFTGCGGDSAYDYDLSEYITVGDYEGLTYDEPDKISISQEDINSAIAEDLSEAKYLKDVSDGKVHSGNTVNIDYVGTIDGEEFDGGSAEGTDLEIGSDTMIDGFEDGLIGKSVGKTVKLNLTFPDDYSDTDLAGKDVVFKVTINSSKKYVTPTEKYYVKNSTDYDSVKEYEEAVEKELYEAEESEQEQEIEQTLWNKVLDSSEVKEYPEKEMESYKEKIKSSIEDYAEENDMEFADVLESYYGMDEEEFESQMTTAAQTAIKEQMVAYYIAREIGVTVSKDEYDDFISAQLDSFGYTAKEFKEYTGSSYEDYVGGETYIYFYLNYQKVIEHIKEEAKAK